MTKTLYTGLDVGSTTIKIAVIDENDKTLYSCYRRHYSEVRQTMVEVIMEAADQFPEAETTLAVAGSGGISAAAWLEAPFVQEVVAGAEAIRRFLPRTDVAIELGGEDAKLTFFDAGIDQRMNETCAGGTGAFIDQMASFLRTDPAGLDELAQKANTIYPIAARCGVFAKSDILPLLNEGAAKEDIAASIFQAVVDQTIGGLACGRSIKGNVAFLGGPLFFLPQLRHRFIETLKLAPSQILTPGDAQLYVAIGTALQSKNEKPAPFSYWSEKAALLAKTEMTPEAAPLPPLFEDLSQLHEFRSRHGRNRLPRADWPSQGGLFVGMDAGSTTTKLVALDEDGRLIHFFYGPNQGNPLKSVIGALKQLYELKPKHVKINRAGITGYGEALIQAALRVDVGEVETVAHYKAAAFFEPEVTFIVDIGGQDIKCLSIKNGVIDRLMLNEACSSGCGSFLETFAKTLGMEPPEFAQTALTASRPVDLGSRCTVFMNSKVKQAQKEGAPVGDISAGLSYSVVRNALYKVIRISRPEEMGDKVVVQGGTFFNDAVLRAFELSIGLEVVRPDIAGLMGAFGAAILAQEHYKDRPGESTLISHQDLKSFTVETKNARCKKCANHCLLTINRFSDGRKYISGNRCERGAALKSGAAKKIDAIAQRAHLGDISPKLAKLPVISTFSKKPEEFTELPNLYKWNMYRLFEVYRPKPLSEARGRVGLPRALVFYDHYPFWFTFFDRLGFRVELSPPSSKEMFQKVLDTIPSQTVCYPAKLVHGHIQALIEARPDFIFFPSVLLEMSPDYKVDARYNCPLVGSYAEVIRLNMDALEEAGVKLLAPFLDIDNPGKMAMVLSEEMAQFKVGGREIKSALKAAYNEHRQYRADIRSAGERALDYVEKHDRTAIILAGHPYHMDPEIHHGISDVIAANGLAVLTCDSIDHLAPADLKLRVTDQWVSHSRLYRGAAVAAQRENVELVQLNSFGCGLDAITTDQVEEILVAAGKVYTVLKIDEGANLGAARIRIRSLLAAVKERRRNKTANSSDVVYCYKPTTIPVDRIGEFTLLCPQMSPMHWQFLAPAMEPSGYKLEVLPSVSREAIEEGLRYVNNDACYPALVSIGQLLSALKSGRYDLSRTAVMMSQTGGGCRATNYVGMLRRALEQMDMGHVPVWPFNLAQSNPEDGMKTDSGLIRRIMLGLLYGDMLTRLLLATRPYEQTPGSALALFQHWSEKAAPVVRGKDFKTYSRHMVQMADEFAALDLGEPNRPKVGLVGEILINFHPEANNHAIEVVEAEGGQAIMPDLTDFFMYCMHDNIYKADVMSGSKIKKWVSRFLIKLIEHYRKPMRTALAKHPRFGHLNYFQEMLEAGSKIVSLGNQTGEGWYLTADMVMMLEGDVPNILCLQPFGCLPNHITGKGVIKELKRRYSHANIVAVDYDPGASEVNQLNRIKLMMSVARDRYSASRK